MVVNNVRKMVCWETVALQENWIRRNVLVLPDNIAEQVVVEFRLAFERHLEADDVRFARVKICLHFFSSEMAAVAVVSRRHVVFCLYFSDALKTLGIAEAVVCFTLVDKFLRIFFVQVKAFALNIRSVWSALVSTLVPFKAEPCHSVIQVFDICFIVAGADGVVKAKNEFSTH